MTVQDDGLRAYLEAVEHVFADEIDYVQLIKVYGTDPGGPLQAGEVNGFETNEIVGDPDQKHVSASYVERQNLTMRMHMRRFTRLTNGFCKKVRNHAHAIAVYSMHYNFC